MHLFCLRCDTTHSPRLVDGFGHLAYNMKVFCLSLQMRTLLVRVVAFIIVMMVGAFLFMIIEGREKDAHSELTIDDIKRNLSSYNVSESDFEIFLDAMRNSTYFPQNHADIPWTFGNSLYFAVVLITTIGYGHISPQTWQGQLFCIFYSLVGIPITALMLKSVGDYIGLGVHHILTFSERRLLNREPLHVETKCFVTTLLLMVFMLIVGGLITTASEGWTMMEGVYFTFVTLSTVGFGDYLLNEGRLVNKSPSKTAITHFSLIFVILGLGVVSSVLCAISKLLETGGFTCCKRMQRNEGNEEEEIEKSAENVEMRTEKQSNSEA